MGSQSQAQTPQQAHARPLANHAAAAGAAQPNNMTSSSNGNGLAPGGASIPRNSSLARQTSIYSVTLDELQRSVMNPESGQMLGSMNMDDFMKSVWSFSENQAMAQGIGEGGGGREEPGGGGGDESMASENGGLARQHSFIRQPSLPRTMSNKTVEEVWQAIVREHPNLENDTTEEPNTAGRGLSTSDGRRTTLGEMTIEAFLMKAGLSVKEDSGLGGQPSTPYSLFSPFASGGTNGNAGPSDRSNERERMGPGSFAATLSLSPANGLSAQAEMESYKQQQGQAQAQVQAQAQQQAADKQSQQQQDQIDWFRNMQQQQAHQQQQQQQQLYQQQAQAQADVYAMQRKVANGGMLPNMGQNGGYTGIASALAPGLSPLGMAQMGGGMALGLPQSSPSHSPASDGVHSHGNGLSLSPVGNYGVMRGRKRGMEGPAEKNVERRQRRMIKNRESAARSRARKQAYTVELEAEVTQLKDENKRLRREKVPNPHHYLNHFLASLKQSFPLDEADVRTKKLVLENIRETGTGRKTLRRTKTGPW